MSNILYVLAAIAIGACVSLQPPINAAMARILESPLLATCISIAISLLIAALLWIAWNREDTSLAEVKALPWWVILGGIIGVVFVVGSVVVAPVLGLASFFVLVVLGQLLGSTFVDQYGAFGMEVKPISLLKLLGLLMVFIGAALFQSSNNSGSA